MSIVNNLTVEDNFYGITTNKGDILVNDGLSNSAFSVSIDSYILSADSSQPFGLRWIPNTSGGGGVPMSDINIVPYDFSTNSVTPIIIPNTSYTNIAGNVLFVGTLNCKMSKSRRYFTVGLYKNNSLIAGTSRRLGGIDGVIVPVSVHQTISLVGTDIFNIQINVDNADCNVNIMGISPYTSSSLLNTVEQISINSTIPYIISDFTFTGASGTIAIIANLNCVINHARSYFTVGLYKNNILVPNTQKQYGGIDNLIMAVPINIIVELIPSDVITVCINSDSTSNTVSVYEKTMLYSVYTSGVSMSPQISITAPTLSTNNTTPLAISDLTLTGISGNYLVMGEINCFMNIARKNFYVGMYLNGSLISFTNKKYGGADSIILSVPYLTMLTLYTTDILEIKVWVDASTYMLTINERSLLYVPY